jgi:polyadenylate-binding protein
MSAPAETETPAAAPEAAPPAAGAPAAAGPDGQAAGGFQAASLYIGDLAPDTNEGLLFEIFNAVGPVSSIRVCRDAVTRRSLGYGYINYHALADAERALDTMNFTEIKGRACRIMWSQRDPSLRRSNVGNIFVKNLHESIDNKQLYDTFSLFGNILSCKVVCDPETGKSKGYGYIHYETAEAATAAIEKLDGMLIDGQEVQVGKFMRRTERPDQEDWTNLYIKNIPREWDDDKMMEEFGKFGEVLSVKVAMGVPRFRPKKKEEPKKEEGDETEEGEKEGEAAEEDKKEEEKAAEDKKEEGSADEDKEEEEGEPKVQSLGYGFVSYTEHEGAVKAIEGLNGKEFTTTINGEEVTLEMFVGRAQKKAERERELRAKFEAEKMDRISKFQGVNLYVKNLDDAVTDDILRDEFSAMGTITSARVMKDMKDGRSRGFGFVCYSTPEEATRAVNEMNGKIIGTKPIFVALAQRKEVRRAQLEARHSGGGRGQPGMRGGPMPMGYPGGMPGMYMQQGRPGPGGMQPAYPMMPGRPGFPNPMMQQQQQRGMYPMPQYGGMPQPGPGGRGGRGYPNQGRGGRGGRGRGQQNMKFNQQARNMPPQQQGVPPTPQQQMPPPQPQAPVPANESLTPSALASASPEMQKNMIGERLYPLIHQSQPELAGKITGMLLEMDNSELLHLLESPDALGAKIQEALQVLEAHRAAQEQS